MKQVTIVQPSVPTYRLDFFDGIQERFGGGLKVHASVGDLGVLTSARPLRPWENRLGPIVRLPLGFEWQTGALGIAVQRDDVVVVSGGPRCLSNLVFLLKARLAGAKVIWWGHYWSSTSKPWRFAIRLMLMKLSHALLFYTDLEVDEYRARMRRRALPAFALNNGISLRGIKTLRAVRDLPIAPKRLIFIGRLTPKASVGLLLEAIAQLEDKNVSLDVIGDGESVEGLRHKASQLGLSDRVAWHGGTTDETKIAAIANAADLFVYPGPVGLSLIHAMAYGLPAVVHRDRRRHGPEISAFQDGETGLAFEVGNSQDLARKIAVALGSPENLRRWGWAARERVDEDYNTDAMVARFEGMLDRLG